MASSALAGASPTPADLPEVLYTLGVLNIGGSELRSLELFEELRRRYPHLSIHVYVQSQRVGMLDERFVEAGARIVRGHTGLRAFGHFYATCRRIRPSIVHTSVGTTNGLLLLAAFLAGVRRRICHFRSTPTGFTGVVTAGKRLVADLLIRRFSTDFVGVSAAARAMVRAPDAKWRTLYEGVACQGSIDLQNSGGVKRIIVLGRISPEKNCLRAVCILEALLAACDDAVVLEYVGPGTPDEIARLEGRIRSSPAANSMSISGPSDRPIDKLRRADLLLHTSRIEGLPGVVLEALSVGTPVVASDLPAVREIDARLGGVTRVPLEADDDVWARAVATALAQPRREEIRKGFASGPFRLEAYADAVADLWELPPR